MKTREMSYVYWEKTGNCGLRTNIRIVPLAYNNKIWAFEEWNAPNALASSSDGTTWTTVNGSLPFSIIAWGGYSSTANGMFMCGGFPSSGGVTNHVWSSMDGVTWNPLADAPWATRYGHCFTLMDHGAPWQWMIVLGGAGSGTYYNDQWHTLDGTTWYNPTSAPAYSARWLATATATISIGPTMALWLMGGENSGVTYNDVWKCIPWPWPTYPYSWNWERVTEHAPWDFASQSISSILLGDKLWVFGRGKISGVCEAWYSYDGEDWTEANKPPIPTTMFSRVVSFADQMWIIDHNGDVWAGTVDLLGSSSTSTSRSSLSSISSLSSLTSTSVSSLSSSSMSTYVKTTSSSQSSSTQQQTTSSSSIEIRQPKLCSIDLNNYSANVKDIDLSSTIFNCKGT